ncbi:hypothetical protein [Sinimarinibacterium sp. CAU 1509]|uniref:hypothetical protein n=1 Tax=Sinimarinibacterium sp. CAU 1509 TaxID=2562283 RepID=UPI00146CC425|nr:hypothetical protein [Sinimarinibacterium sp. CAU 1509]
MHFVKLLVPVLALAAMSAAQAGSRPEPGHDLMNPGSNVVGSPHFKSGLDVNATSEAAVSPDKNGDGFVDATEVEPGSRWATRLQRRDKNGDGKLSRDEYWFP